MAQSTPLQRMVVLTEAKELTGGLRGEFYNYAT
jgi:hypothetical protein